MLATLDVKLNDTGFKIAMVLIGAGGGLLASQLGNVIMSSADPSKASETGGLQGTALNLGASIGTALIGAILILNLINGFNDNIADNPQVPAQARETIAANTEEGIDIVPVAQVEQRALSKGLSEDQAKAVAADYGDAQLDALRSRIGAVAAIALLSPLVHAEAADLGRRAGHRAGPRRGRRLPPDPFGPAAGKPTGGPNRRKWPENATARAGESGPRDVAAAGRAMGAVRREGRERLRPRPASGARHLRPRLADRRSRAGLGR